MKILSDGDYKLNNSSGLSVSILYLSGIAGSATVSVGYKNEEGTIVPLLGGEVALGQQYPIQHGKDVELYLQVSGSTPITKILVDLAGDR